MGGCYGPRGHSQQEPAQSKGRGGGDPVSADLLETESGWKGLWEHSNLKETSISNLSAHPEPENY